MVDRRLGDDAALARCVAAFHKHGMRVLLDGVFHHVGRDFWAFRDLQAHGEHSPYRDWFSNVRFDTRSPYGDPFSYDGWNGHASLVKLNLSQPAVRTHLFDAVAHWVRAFDIDGLRIDAADCIDCSSLAELAQHCRKVRPAFWLLGEVIHGDYRTWANPDMFDSVTNYQAYRGLYSSHNARNYFEIAHTLNQQFGPGGVYQQLFVAQEQLAFARATPEECAIVAVNAADVATSIELAVTTRRAASHRHAERQCHLPNQFTIGARKSTCRRHGHACCVLYEWCTMQKQSRVQ